MAIRGETIGTAYVRILADGKGFDKSVKQVFDKQADQMQTQGEEHSDLYWEGFNEHTRESKKTTIDSIMDHLQAGAGVYDAEGKDISAKLINGIRDGMVELHKEKIGTQIALDIKKDMQEGLIGKPDLPDILADQRTLVTRAINNIRRDEAEDAAEFRREQETQWRIHTNNILTNVKTTSAEINRSMRERRDLLRDVSRDLAEATRMNIADEKLLQKAMRDTQTEFTKTTKKVEEFTEGAKAGIGDRRQMIRDITLLRSRMSDFGQLDDRTSKLLRNLRRDLILANPVLDRFSTRVDNLSDRMGHAFGRGSRNNFLNWFGSMVRGGVRLIKLFPAIGEVATDVFRVFTNGFRDAKDAGNGFFSAMATGFADLLKFAGSSIGSAAVALAVLAGAIQLVALIIGPVVAALSMLVGIVAALASTIAFALVGALAPLAGLIAPIALAIGGVAFAFIGMDEAEKKVLKHTFKPLKDEIDELGDAAREPIFDALSRNAEKFEDIISGWRPLFRRIGETFGGFIDRFGEFATSPPAEKFKRFLNRTIPGQIERMGTIFGNVGEAMMGVFTVLGEKGGPVDQFLDWMVDITDEFAEWANSRKGRKEMREFFKRAGDSAKALGGFLKEVFDFVVKIIDKGQEPGNDIFERMAGGIADATEFLTSPEGQDALDQWFADAQDLAEEIGKIVDAIVHLVDVLDTPENRKIAKQFFGALADIINFIADHWDVIQKLAFWFAGFLANLLLSIIPLGWVLGIFKDLWKWGKKVWEKMKDWWEAIKDFAERSKRKLKEFKDWLDRKWEDLKRKPKEVWDWIRRKFGDLWDWVKQKARDAVQFVIDKFQDLKDKVSEIPGKIREKFADLWARLREGASDAKAKVIEKLQDLVEWAREIPGKIRDLADKFLAAGKTLGSNLWDGLQEGISSAADWAAGIAESVGGALVGLINDMIDKINSAIPNSLGWGKFKVDIDDNPVPHISLASGGIFAGGQMALIGEAGPEAVVPLNRPLSQVDPAVRELSAIAQGLSTGRGVDIGGITIITPTEDPAAVAEETINRLVASTYF